MRAHADAARLYQPLLIGRLLPLPTPTPLLVHGIFWLLVFAGRATGRAPRLLGWTVFLLYFEWMIIAMSYGKVDHDRFALLVALAVLPTVGGAARRPGADRGRRLGAAGHPARGGRTYFLAAWAKLRFGGIDWVTSSVLARAILRRGTDLADLIAPVPCLLIAAQAGIIAFELASPLIFFLKERWRYAGVAFFYSFHLFTSPCHDLVRAAPGRPARFLPLERLRPVAWARGAVSTTRPRPPDEPAHPVPEPAPSG